MDIDSYYVALPNGNMLANYNSWTHEVVEKDPDGSTTTVYSNYAGETLLTDVWNGQTTGSQHWYTFNTYDDSSHLLLSIQPSAISNAVANSNGTFTMTWAGTGASQGHVGLVNVYTYYASTSTSISETTPGGVAGYLDQTGVQQGYLGTSVWQTMTDYVAATGSNAVTQYYPYDSTEYGVYDPNTSTYSDQRTTTYQYSFDTTGPVPLVTNVNTVFPVVGNGQGVQPDQNGSGVAAHTYDDYDQRGELIWSMDADGRVTYNHYDSTTGRLLWTIQDVGQNVTSSPVYSDITDAFPTGWPTFPATGLNLETNYSYDPAGRLVQTLGPIHERHDGVSMRTATWTRYDDIGHQILSAQGWATWDSGDSKWDNYTLANPISVTKYNLDGNVLEQIQLKWEDSPGDDYVTHPGAWRLPARLHRPVVLHGLDHVPVFPQGTGFDPRVLRHSLQRRGQLQPDRLRLRSRRPAGFDHLARRHDHLERFGHSRTDHEHLGRHERFPGHREHGQRGRLHV